MSRKRRREQKGGANRVAMRKKCADGAVDGVTVVNAAFEQLSAGLQQVELLQREESVVDAVGLVRSGRPRRHGHRPQIQIIADRVLQLMILRSFRKAGVQVQAQILG